jgi:hypothetical protein
MKTLSRLWIAPAVLLGWAVALTTPVHALSIGQVDTFQTDTDGWTVNLLGMGVHPAPPITVPDGPAGGDDRSLLIRAVGGAGPGSRLSTVNFMGQWAGDYLAAGINAISMDVRNLTLFDLYLRLMFEDPVLGPPENIAYSADPIFIPAGAAWTSVVFPIGVSDLAAGLGDVTTALTNTTAIRLYHSFADNFPNPVFPIDSVVGEIAVDNIRALGVGAAVPAAHSTLAALSTALALLGVLRLRLRSPISWRSRT